MSLKRAVYEVLNGEVGVRMRFATQAAQKFRNFEKNELLFKKKNLYYKNLFFWSEKHSYVTTKVITYKSKLVQFVITLRHLCIYTIVPRGNLFTLLSNCLINAQIHVTSFDYTISICFEILKFFFMAYTKLCHSATIQVDNNGYFQNF